MKMKWKYWILIGLTAAIIAQNASSVTLSSSDYKLDIGVLDSAGGNFSSANYNLFIAVGEEAVGDYQSSSYNLHLGFPAEF